ncbi:MAG: hypothetical protein IJX74_00545 [Clostridia bacterium]|nr:hypothetical protein [Clostridia bacterium]
MDVQKITLTSGRFIPSRSEDLEKRIDELEKYLMLLTEELEKRSDNTQ